MYKKEIKLLENTLWDKLPRLAHLRSIEDIENELKKHKELCDTTSIEIKIKQFEENYKYTTLYRLWDKKEAEKFFIEVFWTTSLETVRILEYLVGLGMREKYETGNISILKNALHTINRIDFGSCLGIVSGYNHSISFTNVIYAFADCDINLVRKLFPQELGLADKQTHKALRVGSNLIISQIHQNNGWIEESYQLGEKFIKQKSNAKSDILITQYLMALFQHNIIEASVLLQEIADLYKKMSTLFFVKGDIYKLFGAYLHGLYNIAYFTLPKNLFEQLSMPDSPAFWKDFQLYTEETGYSKGKLILNLNNNLSPWRWLFDSF